MLPFLLVRHGADQLPLLVGRDEGLVGFDLVEHCLYSFDPEDAIAAVSIDPAGVYFGLDITWSEEVLPLAAEQRLPRFAPRGYKFGPLPPSVVSGFPSARLLSLRASIPSLETIRLSTIFAGSTIMVTIEEAEKSFACIADVFVRAGRRFAPLEEIIECIEPLGLRGLRRALYIEFETWAPAVRSAIASGLKDRALRKHLFLGTSLPSGISLAKLSFTLALLGHDCVCLDTRLLGRMFERRAREIAKAWDRVSELSLKRYEKAEDAFLKGNPFYDPRDPIGRARAQWASWESVGGGPAEHRVWLDVVAA